MSETSELSSMLDRLLSESLLSSEKEGVMMENLFPSSRGGTDGVHF